MKISARNVFAGTVVAIKAGTVNSEVTIEVAPGVQITAVVTKSSVKHLGLRKGKPATAIIKASSVLVATE
jgi:molybdopterin-binding protein